MKICIICESANSNARAYCESFARAGHRVDVIALPGYKDWRMHGGRIHRVHTLAAFSRCCWLVNFIALIIQCRFLVRKIRPDILNPIFLFDCGFFGAAAGFHPLVLTPLGSDVLLYPFQRKTWMRMVAYMIGKADGILSNSPVMTQALTEKLNTPYDRIMQILWNGIDTHAFRPFDARQLRKELGVEDKFLIFSNRRLSLLYNIESIICMFREFVRIMPRSHLLIAGEGALKKKLEKMCRANGLAGNVALAGWISYERMPAYMNACDLFLTVPGSDSCASSLLEAFACKKPVVASDIPANRAWIRHGENGWLVAPEDTKSFVNTCIEAARTPVAQPELERNRARVIAEADTARNMAKVVQEFQVLAARFHR